MDRLDLGQRDFRRILVLEEGGVGQQKVNVFPQPFKGGTGDHQVERQGSGGARPEGQDTHRNAIGLSGSDGEVFGDVADYEIGTWLGFVQFRLRLKISCTCLRFGRVTALYESKLHERLVQRHSLLHQNDGGRA